MRPWTRAALAALAVATLAGCSSAGGEAPPSPSPSHTIPAPSPTPTASLDANGRALPGFVTANPDLPPALAAPAGILETTGPGWSLQTYRPAIAEVATVADVTPGVEATVQVLYLLSPDGSRYQLLELDPAAPLVVTSWTSGESIAYVTQCDLLACHADAPAQTLDLLTGELTPVESVGADASIGATLPGSHRWWESDSEGSALDSSGTFTSFPQNWLAHSASPSGEYLAVVRANPYSATASAGVAIADTATGTLTDLARLWDENLSCEPFRWRADDALDVNCWDASRETWRIFTVGPGAQAMKENKAATATPPDEGPWVEPDVFVTEGVWAGPYTADAAAREVTWVPGIGLARNAGFEPLSVPDAGVGSVRIVAAVEGSLFLRAAQELNPTLVTAWRYDVAENSWTELGPLPAASSPLGFAVAAGSPALGLTSWAVAP